MVPPCAVREAIFLLLLAASSSSLAGPIAIEAPARKTPVEFETEILPILRANCLACHNAKKAESNLNLETPQTILKGGDSGPAVVAGKGKESLLLKVASHQVESVMPPENNLVGAKALTPEQLGLVQLWIDQGAAGNVAATRSVRWQPLPKSYLPILAAAITPDGQFAVAARGNQLSVYHVPSGTLAALLVDSSAGQAAHQDVVRSLAFDPSGDLLASGGFREVKLWRRPRVSGRALAPGAQWAHEAPVTAVAVSADGRLAATGDEAGRVRLWEIASGKTTLEVRAHEGAITGLAYAPDGTALYSCSLDKSLRCWKVADGTPLGKPILGPSPHSALVLLKNGEWLASGAADGQVRVWETKTLRGETEGEAKPLAEFKAHVGAVAALAAHPMQVGELYSGGEDGLIRRWEAQSAKQLSELRNEGPVVALAVRPDGQRLASAGASYVKLWNTEDGKQVAHLSGDPRLAAKVAKAESQVAFAKSAVELAKQDIKLYEGVERRVMTTAEEVKKAEQERDKVQKTRDEKKAAAEKAKADDKDKKEIEAADKALAEAETAVVVAGTVIERAKGVAERAVKDLAAAQAAVVAQEEQLKIEVAAKEAAAAEAKGTQQVVRSLAFSSENRRLAVGCDDGALHFYDAQAGTILETAAEHSAAVRTIVFTADGTLISASADRRALIWHAPSQWRLERTIGPSRPDETLADRVLGLDFSPDGKSLATGGGIPSRSGEVKIWNVADGRLVRELKDAHADTVFGVRYSPDGQRLATASADRLLKIFAVETGESSRVCAGHTAHVLGVSWHASGKWLVSCGADSGLKLWDAQSGLALRSLKGTTYQIGPYRREVTGVAFIGASEQMLACSGDGTVRLHRASSESDILTFAGSKSYQSCVAVTPDGQTAVSGGGDGALRVWSGHAREPKLTFGP